MRIITGSAKGTKLKTPKGLETRPTADRVKESVFNILGDIVIEASVLDLFAGTGNLGLEALSRGATSCLFIDQSLDSINIIKDNIIRTKLTEKAEIYKNDALRALDKNIKAQRMFSLIFCDPPYNQGLSLAVLEKIDNNNVLFAHGVIVIEHSSHELIKADWKTLQLKRTEKYGQTLVSFLKKKNPEVTGG